MWQPNRAQWRVIWIAAALLILAWPPIEGGSLAVKAVRWLADPRHTLPQLPEPLPMGLGDDGDRVAEHDRQAQEYYEYYDSSAMNRLRLRLKFAEEPLDPGTERQLTSQSARRRGDTPSGVCDHHGRRRISLAVAPAVR